MEKKNIGFYFFSALQIYMIGGHDEEILAKLVPIYTALHIFIDESILSYLLATLLFLLTVWFLYTLFLKKKGFLSHSILYFVSSVFVFVEMVRHPVNILLFSLFSSALFVGFILETSVLLDAKKYGFVFKRRTLREGFIADVQKLEDNEKVGWEKYADNLVERLMQTDTSKASFAVALTGQWGTGKTTFLNLLKNKLATENVLMIDFNPWLSDSSKMIINDYFNSLKEMLVGKEPEIDKLIDKYVSLLLNWQVPTFFEKINEYFGKVDNQGLQTIRKQLSEVLNELGKPIVVFIDDTDRLQQDEILEVMKLIRNTADFSNMFYIVTFDKEYVVRTINSIIVEPALYLKKIFQLELKFPIFERYLLTHFLLSELDKYHRLQDVKLRSNLANIEMCLQSDDIYLEEYFDNFRDVKRFVNGLLLVLDYIEYQGIASDFYLHDLFLIELLNYTDEAEYEQLKKIPMERLESRDSSDVFQLKSKFNQEPSENSKKILRAIFSQQNSLNKVTDYVSMKRKNKFYTYFSFRPFAYQMGVTEFSNILKMQNDAEVRNEIRKSRSGIFSKSAHIYDLMISTRIYTLEAHALKNYMIVLVEWTKMNLDFDKKKIVVLYNKVLSSKLANGDECVKEVRLALESIFRWLMQNIYQGCYILQSILSSTLTGSLKHINGEFLSMIHYKSSNYSSLIEEYNGKNIDYFLESIQPSLYSLCEDSQIHAFITNSAIYSENTMPRRPLMSSVEKQLLVYFSKNKDTNDYKKFFNSFYYVDLSFNHEDGGDEALENRIKKYFISVPFYLRFLRECFNYETPDILDDYINKNNLQRWIN